MTARQYSYRFAHHILVRAVRILPFVSSTSDFVKAAMAAVISPDLVQSLQYDALTEQGDIDYP